MPARPAGRTARRPPACRGVPHHGRRPFGPPAPRAIRLAGAGAVPLRLDTPCRLRQLLPFRVPGLRRHGRSVCARVVRCCGRGRGRLRRRPGGGAHAGRGVIRHWRALRRRAHVLPAVAVGGPRRDGRCLRRRRRRRHVAGPDPRRLVGGGAQRQQLALCKRRRRGLHHRRRRSVGRRRRLVAARPPRVRHRRVRRHHARQPRPASPAPGGRGLRRVGAVRVLRVCWRRRAGTGHAVTRPRVWPRGRARAVYSRRGPAGRRHLPRLPLRAAR